MNDPNTLERLRSILTKGTVTHAPEDIAAARVSNPLIDSQGAPGCVARPADAAEAQGLIQLANEIGLNLTVASSTGEHYRGGTAAASESVRIDLSTMKEIGWINRRNRVCMIEPGVTYGELLDALAPHGLTISMPLAPRSGKSVLASALDREPSTWPNKQWDSGDPVASTEFIFGSGEIFRTGAAGGPGTLEQQRAAGGAQKSPAGPSQTDFHRVVQGSQGTMGVVTWITMRTELKPTLQKTFLVGVEVLKNIIPFVYEVQRAGLGEHSFILDRTSAAALMSARADVSSPESSFEAIRDSLPAFVCLQNIAGFERLPKERVEYQLNDVGAIAKKHGLSMESGLGKVSAEDLLSTATSPSANGDWRRSTRGHCLSVFFLTTLDRAAYFRNIFLESANKHKVGADRVGLYIQPVVQNHACHVEFMVPFADADSSEVDRMRIFEREVVPELANAGAYFSRPYGRAQDIAFDRNAMNYEILAKVKNIFDPQKVLNRGKWGL